MCDWDAEEYAEYLLWVEAEKVRSRSPRQSVARPAESFDIVVVSPTPVDA